MKIGIPKEVLEGETRVAIIPSMVDGLVRTGHEVFVESGCGDLSNLNDEQYKKVGATVVEDTAELYKKSEIIVKVNPPMVHPKLNQHEAELLNENSVFIGYLSPLTEKEAVQKLVERKVTAFAMEYVPRITRAQSMDSLSSMATVSGYKAVLIAANQVGKLFPLLMTAAGTVAPANVLILGAGVAGLQAIATAKRLGAKVQAFDPRAAVKEQVESLGATFVPMEMPEDAETEGGYAKEMGDEFLKKEQEAIATRLPRMDAVITTAQIFGKKLPILITEDMLKKMKPGSVIVDLAAAQGGNCALTEAGQVVERYGVTIFGEVNLPAKVQVDASQMYSKNTTNLFKHLYQDAEKGLDFEDEITSGACITRDGEIANEMVKKALQGGE